MIKYVVIYENRQNNNFTEELVKSHEGHQKNFIMRGNSISGGLAKTARFEIEANSQEEIEDFISKDPLIIYHCFSSYRICAS